MLRLVVLVFLLAGLILLAWLARAEIAARLAGEYFRQHGVTASVGIGDLGFAGVSGRFALGPQDAPDISAARMELHFDPLSWTPRVVEVRLVDPVIRARVDAAGHVTLGSLQAWIDSLSNTQGHSRFVSDDLAVSLQGLRALVATPAGTIELDGDVKLVRGLPVTAALHLVPAHLVYRGVDIALGAARMTYDAAKAHLAAQFSGTVQTTAISARQIQANLDATNFQWANAGGRLSLTTALAHLQVQAQSLTAAVPIAAPVLDITARNVAFAISKDIEGQADVSAGVRGGFTLTGLRTPDPVLTRVVAQNLTRLTANLSAHVERHGGVANFTLAKPLSITGARGATLRVPLLRLNLSPDGLTGAVQAQLRGPGLPVVSLASQRFAFAAARFRGDADISARGDMAMLHGAVLTARGDVSLQDGRFTFAPSACMAVTLKAFHPGDSDLARDISGAICGAPGQPLLSVAPTGWRFNGVGQKVSGFLPLANAQVSGASAGLSFQGLGNNIFGAASVTAMQVADQTAPKRFEPLAASGIANLKNWVWQGRFTVAAKNYPLGEATFTHTMATGVGGAHISAPGLAFAENGLQPVALSPLLAALRNADGKVHFDGDVAWTKAEIKSGGTLGIDSLDFLTPLGRAHAVKTSIAFSSLLPPATADNQHLTISRIDWTLPLSGVDVHFGFDPKAARIGGFATDIAQGHVALGAFSINLADPGHLAGDAQLSSIALGALVSASNLGSKLKLDGKVSGHLPFTLTPDGFRIIKGHVEADGPGRLSIDRSLWGQGAAVSNAVQDFAYQALENLSFDSMTADLNSVANGRLQILFHIKGRSDPPKPQTADIPVTDLINGTALQKSIPLPSGTPIDLTLDTSLNFDELLKSYAEAWSKSLSPLGASGQGATP